MHLSRRIICRNHGELPLAYESHHKKLLPKKDKVRPPFAPYDGPFPPLLPVEPADLDVSNYPLLVFCRDKRYFLILLRPVSPPLGRDPVRPRIKNIVADVEGMWSKVGYDFALQLRVQECSPSQSQIVRVAYLAFG